MQRDTNLRNSFQPADEHVAKQKSCSNSHRIRTDIAACALGATPIVFIPE
jgi:hypothetical protein